MQKETIKFLSPYANKNLPKIKAGDTVIVYQKVKEGSKQKEGKKFEGVVLMRKHNKEIGATITVRNKIDGIGVEKIFPLHSSVIEKIEIIKNGKVRRAKLNYLRKK